MILTRPRGVILQLLCEDTDPRRIGCIAVGLTALLIGAAQVGIVWNAYRLCALIFSILCGMLLVLALFLIECVFTIYSVKSL